jgi:hypothetical protein
LRGESPERIKFLRKIIEKAPANIQPLKLSYEWMSYQAAGIQNKYYLVYLGSDQPRSLMIDLPNSINFNVEVIDTWNMTITPISKTFSGRSLIELFGRPYTALGITAKE